MKFILLFIGVALLTISFVIMDFSSLLKNLGFKEESLDVLKDAIAISILGFALFIISQPKIVVKPPSFKTIVEY